MSHTHTYICASRTQMYVFVSAHLLQRRTHIYILIYIDTYIIVRIFRNAVSNFCTQATDEEKKDAFTALTKYETLTDSASRQRFIKQFADGGSGTGKDSLKFAQSFAMSLAHEDKTVVEQTEDYLSVGQILQFEGQSLGNFPSMAMALEDCKYLVKKNARLHCWDELEHPAELDEEKPEYSKFWYVKGHGKKTSWSQVEKKELQGEAALKGAKQLADGTKFLECLGFEQAVEVTAIANVKHELMTKELETVKYTYQFSFSVKRKLHKYTCIYIYMRPP